MIDSRHNWTASDEVFGTAVEHIVARGSAAGTRAISVAPAGGIHARVLSDRGLDIGAAWVKSQPIAWLSSNGETPAGRAEVGDRWHDRWAGGLITTCGLRNVGSPSEEHGRHGRYSELAATDIAIHREVRPDNSGNIVIDGTIIEPVGLGRGIRVDRRIEFAIGAPRLLLTDVAVNETSRSLQTPLLYHVNLGYPFVGPDSRPLLRSDVSNAEEPSGVAAMGNPVEVPDVVTELDVRPDTSGHAVVTIDSSQLDLRMEIEWDATSMPRLFCWQRRSPGEYVLAIEPANCSVSGRAADRAAGNAPMLEPGEIRRTTLSISFTRKEANS